MNFMMWMTKITKNLPFTKKKSYIRFYSGYEGVVDIFPVIKSSFLKRNCLDKKAYQEERLATSNCPAIRKITSAGFIVPAPADFEITTNGDGTSLSWIQPVLFTKGYPGSESYISSHPPTQTVPLLNDLHTTLQTIIKVETPWRVDTSDDIVFLQMPVSYCNESRFEAAVGILDPKQCHVINVQVFWKVLNDKTIIKAGTPLCQLIPINRKELSLNGIDVSVGYANETDNCRERSYNYSAHCVFYNTDNLSSRLSRAHKVLTKYGKGSL